MSLYFIAILPPESLRERIKALKMELAEKYHARHALKLPAHLTLQIPFRISEKNEEKLKEFLRKFTERQEAFQVKADGFGRFSRKVLFVKVAENPAINELHRELQREVDKVFHLKENEKSRNFHPHFTLATRDLSYKDFEPAWKELQARDFRGIFTATSLVLFKHNGKTWDEFEEFYLQASS